MNKQPAAKIDLYWPITAAIWRNESNDGNRAFYTVSIERSYKDKEGKLQTATSFTADDLLVVSKVADLAHSEIHHLRKGDRAAQVEPGSEG